MMQLKISRCIIRYGMFLMTNIWVNIIILFAIKYPFDNRPYSIFIKTNKSPTGVLVVLMSNRSFARSR